MMKRAIEAIHKGYFDLPFYTEHCKKSGVNLTEVRTEEQFLKIPFTVKEDLRNSSAYSRTRTASEEIYGLYSSNGTTGKKTFYVHSQLDHRKQAEYVRTFYSALGMKAGGLGAVFGPIGSPVMGHCMIWQFHAMKMGMTLCPQPSPENIIDVIQSLPVTDIATLPQVASFLAASPEWREIAAKSSVERLILGGDFLSEARRKLLEETWDAKVYNSFGMSEVFGPIGNECMEQNGFHYFDQDLYIEVVSPETGEPVEPGKVGIGVYTTLWTRGSHCFVTGPEICFGSCRNHVRAAAGFHGLNILEGWMTVYNCRTGHGSLRNRWKRLHCRQALYIARYSFMKMEEYV